MDSSAIGRAAELLARAWERGGGRAGADGPAAVRLNEPETYALLAAAGLAVAPSAVLPAPADEASRAAWGREAAGLAGDGGRLVLKVVGREILHKSDVGGVSVLDLGAVPAAERPARAVAAAGTLLDAVGAAVPAGAVEGVLASAFVPHRAQEPGQELLLSLRQDPAFGPVVVVGIGGLLTEWYGHGSGGRSRVIFPAAGLSEAAVAAALTAHPLLRIVVAPSRLHREAPVPAAAAARVVVALAELASAFAAAAAGPWTLEELEINPAVVSGGRLVALDGLGLLSRRRWQEPRRPLAKIRPLLAPRSAVVLGASAKGANPGRIILGNLRRSAGIPADRLAVVHHQEKEIDGVPCVARLSDLPWKADLAVVSVPATVAGGVIEELVAGDRAESIILIPGGFAEAGAHDLAAGIERTLRDGHARPGGGPVMVGGNCLGIVSRDRYNTFFLPPAKLPFHPGAGENLAIVSQSGAYLVTFASNYDGLIYPAASISYGNQMDLTVADFLRHFVGEPAVTVIACYIEGFRGGDGAGFLEATRAARAAGKRVIVYKAGKTPLGAKAAASHTASLAGDYDVARACLLAAGAVVAETLDEFEDLIKTFTLLQARRPGGRRVGVLSNAGFECATVTDRLDGLELASLDESARAALDACLPPFAHRDNPIDTTPMADTEAVVRASQAVMDCPGVDCAILSAVPVAPTLDTLPADPQGRHREDLDGPASLGRRWVELWERTGKPFVCVVDSGRLYDPLASLLERGGIPVFRKIDRAARALSAFVSG